jgi:hypothetical protein
MDFRFWPILLKNSAVGSSVESVGESCRAD